MLSFGTTEVCQLDLCEIYKLVFTVKEPLVNRIEQKTKRNALDKT